MVVILRANAFVGLVASIAEGFKNEVGGLVFGDHYVTPGKFVVDFVVPLQTAKRKPSEVHYHPKRTGRVRSVWDDLSPFWYLGSFHSHPEYGGRRYSPVPSETDENEMDLGELEIIVSIWKSKRKEPLGYIRDGFRISGAVGDYYIQMSSWYRTIKGEISEMEVWCPYIEVINEGYTQGIVSKWGRLFEQDTVVSEAKLRTLRRRIQKYESEVIRNTDNYESAFSEVRQTIRDIVK
ncbi:MAG: Mov34/MPN/PAD-1 family protein [Candidatus Thorarchaeota archaeon]|nr:MAG: Mov34/MPN/PAD-1 family protein [Candidatus Thorarchaeota archaeon]